MSDLISEDHRWHLYLFIYYTTVATVVLRGGLGRGGLVPVPVRSVRNSVGPRGNNLAGHRAVLRSGAVEYM